MGRIYIFLSAAFLLFQILPPLSAGEPTEGKRVLVLCSEDRDNPGQEMVEQGIREGFRSNKTFDVQLYTEYLDVSRFGGLSHAHPMAEFLRRRYSGMRIDVIITVYPYALDFLLAQRRALFPGLPIIAAAITGNYAENLESSTARRFITGTIARGNLMGLIDDALRLRPKTKRIAVVAGTAPNDILSDQQNRAVLKRYAEKIDLIDLTKLSMEETLSRVGSLSPDTIVFYSTIFRDGAGKSFVPREALSLIARASKVPVFGFFEGYLGYGIVGGQLVSLKEHGREAVDLALGVMAGKSPASIPFGGKQAYVTAYDWRELKRWNIPETTVPPGAEIRYRASSFWEKYRRAIIGVITLIIVETCLIVGLLVNFRRRRKTEVNQERTLAMLKERELLARDLHDGIGQMLAAAHLQAKSTEELLARGDIASAESCLHSLAEVTQEGKESIREYLLGVKARSSPEQSLFTTLRQYLSQYKHNYGIHTELVVPPEMEEKRFDPTLEIQLQSIIQEALTNVRRHSGAFSVRVIFALGDGEIRVTVEDNGRGYDPEQISETQGFGLRAMRGRADMVGARLEINSVPGKGTRVTIQVPWRKDKT